MDSLSHTKWNCQYHIVFTPQYRRKTMYNNMCRSFFGQKDTVRANKNTIQ